MARTIQVRSVPEEVHRRLKMRAAAEGRTLSELVRAELTEVAARPTLAEVLERVQAREPSPVKEPSAAAIRAERRAR